MRLGFSVRIFGRADLASHDGRRQQHLRAHWSVNLIYLRDILGYLRANDIHMYRLHSELAPYDREQAAVDWAQLDECRAELEAVGALARAGDIRLSFHPYSAVVLNAVNEEQVARSVACLQAEAALLDGLGLGPEAVVVLHVGGVYDNAEASRERFVRRYAALPEGVRRRVVLENDDHRFSHADTRAIHEQCGVALVLDQLHHLVHNPEGIPMREALEYALGTWPAGVTPKIHFSSPRTEMRQEGARIKLPTWTEHSDFVNPFEFIAFMREMAGLPPLDIMLESKARDLALLKLREELHRFEPDWAQLIR